MNEWARRLRHLQNLSAREYRSNSKEPFLDDMLLLQAHREGMVELSLQQKQRLFVLSHCLMTVYFIAAVDAGKIKIGKTTNIQKRMAALTTVSPVELTLLHTVQYDARLEKRIHDHLKEYRAHGEWFHADKPVLDFIRNVKKEGITWLVNRVGDAPHHWMNHRGEMPDEMRLREGSAARPDIYPELLKKDIDIRVCND